MGRPTSIVVLGLTLVMGLVGLFVLVTVAKAYVQNANSLIAPFREGTKAARIFIWICAALGVAGAVAFVWYLAPYINQASG